VRKTTRQATRVAPARPKPDPLPPHQRRFVQYYAVGLNGTRAYLAAYPNCKSHRAAATKAYELLRKPAVQAAVVADAAEVWKKLQMSGEEALLRVSLDARADVRELYDHKGRLLPVHLWPDCIANSVKSVRPGKEGTTIVLNDSLAARRLILEQTGKLKNPLAGVGDLARILAGDFKEDE